MIKKGTSNTLLAFVSAVANGMDQGKAYTQFLAKKKTLKPTSAVARASRLLRRPEINKMYDEAIEVRKKVVSEVIKEQSRVLAREFSAIQLTTDELDSFHSAVIQGQVEMIENIVVYTWQEELDELGNVVKRIRNAGIMKATRPPNIKEKQASVDALYRRRKAYPAVSGFKTPEDGEEEIVDYILNADGSKTLLFPQKQIKG